MPPDFKNKSGVPLSHSLSEPFPDHVPEEEISVQKLTLNLGLRQDTCYQLLNKSGGDEILS